MIGSQDRIVGIARWAWTFPTRDRRARLITGAPLRPPIERPEAPGPAGPPSVAAARAAATVAYHRVAS